MNPSRLVLVLALVAGCATAGTPELASVTRMAFAPPREPGCALEFVEASVVDMSPIGRYDVLGYVMVRALAVANPYAEENRKIVRPRACELGGQAVSIALSATGYGAFGQPGSGTVYAVLKLKSTVPAPPQAF